MKWNELENEACPVARGLSVIGDRWTLLILRDCFLGVRRFDRFQEHIGMTRHVLADRLKKLVEADILRKLPYQERPVRYEYRLTHKGKSLFPILMMLISWADEHMPMEGPIPYEFLNKDTGKTIKPALYDETNEQRLELRKITLKDDDAGML
jgi:DNA-binding HxlR family transcriptional regulator